ncbi:MAG: glycosyltransferase family 39 protein [Veillonella sp.]|nr:glycosyltransferase family 39 protein [Veillonella sp.]
MKLHRLTLVLTVVFLALYAVGNSFLPVTDPVESNYALTAKEMVQSGNWLSPQIYHMYWYDKPIMVYWALALSYSVFGITDFAARFPSALFGALSVGLMYQAVRSVSQRRLLALWSALLLGTSLEFWIMARGIVTDMILLFASVGTFCYAYRGMTEGKTKYMAWAYAYAGFGTLTKGPVALVLPGLLFLVFAAVSKSWTMVKRLFPWQGILAFLVVAAPWYGYMYMAHGQDFVNGFLGLNNVVRATQSEHPQANHWWYYLAMFPAMLLPWTGAVLYGMWHFRKRCTPFYVYAMITGWGTILFYTCMATKYPTYTFISLIPFSFLGAVGVIKLVRPGASKKLWWWLLGPAFFLWGLFAVASFFVPWGFWYLLYVIVAVGILGGVWCLWTGKRYVLPVFIGAVTMLISGVVLYEGLAPLVIQRSSVTYLSEVEHFSGPLYYYADYATSLVYYTDRPVMRIEEPGNNSSRSSAWSGKYTMPSESEAVAAQKIAHDKSMIIVPKGRLAGFEKSPIYPLVRQYSRTDREYLFVTK